MLSMDIDGKTKKPFTVDTQAGLIKMTQHNLSSVEVHEARLIHGVRQYLEVSV